MSAAINLDNAPVSYALGPGVTVYVTREDNASAEEGYTVYKTWKLTVNTGDPKALEGSSAFTAWTTQGVKFHLVECGKPVPDEGVEFLGVVANGFATIVFDMTDVDFNPICMSLAE